jgi:hypothetical protein
LQTKAKIKKIHMLNITVGRLGLSIQSFIWIYSVV